VHQNETPSKTQATKNRDPKFSKKPYTQRIDYLPYPLPCRIMGKSYLPELRPLVAIVLFNTLQAVTFLEGKIFNFQNSARKSPTPPCATPLDDYKLPSPCKL